MRSASPWMRCGFSGRAGCALFIGACLASAITSAGEPAAGTPGISALAKSAKRIPWAQAFQERSPHFLIVTNTSAKLAKEMSQALEQQYTDFLRRFVIKKEPKNPLPIKVFAEKAEFKKYIQEGGAKITEHAAGFFDPNKKEIVLYWSDDPEDVLSTLYHETTHYFVDLFMPRAEAPLWMNEGLAVYFETAQFKNGRLETGQIPYGRLLELQEALKAGKQHKLSALVKMNDYGAGGYDQLAYAEGWSLVYFFATFQRGQHAQRFGFYMEELQKGRPPALAFKNAFQVGPDEIEPIWKDFVLKLGMDSARGWYERGLALWYDQKYEEALAACEKALQLDPKFMKARHLKGSSFYFLKRLPEALEVLSKSTADDPTDPRNFFYLARIHEGLVRSGNAMGNEAGQEAAYRRAIELRPDYADALGFLAWFYATARDAKFQKIKEAVPLAEKAVELDPTSEVLDTLAECYHQDGQKAKAIAAANRALALHPPDKKYYQDQLKKFEGGK